MDQVDVRISDPEENLETMNLFESSYVCEPKKKYPHCLVWSPIPCLTWFIPFIGHLGITNEEGVSFDFAGPYTIGQGQLAFGECTRYIELNLKKIDKNEWDSSIKHGNRIYRKRMHNLCCDNCHSHVACCLNDMNYNGFSQWNMIILCFWMFFCGKYVSLRGVLAQWLPFVIVMTIVYFANN